MNVKMMGKNVNSPIKTSHKCKDKCKDNPSGLRLGKGSTADL